MLDEVIKILLPVLGGIGYVQRTMGLKKLYIDIYERFQEKHAQAHGYDFQESASGSARPKPVTFTEKLKWWTLDRPKRLRAIVQERDRLQQDILSMKRQDDSPPDSSPQ